MNKWLCKLFLFCTDGIACTGVAGEAVGGGQIHTPGTSRKVQRSVSVLRKTGLCQRDSEIWGPLQIVGAVPLHAWGRNWKIPGVTHRQRHIHWNLTKGWKLRFSRHAESSNQRLVLLSFDLNSRQRRADSFRGHSMSSHTGQCCQVSNTEVL